MDGGPRLVVALTVLVCFAAGTYAAGIDASPMTADDAKEFAGRALDASGVQGATIADKVESTTFTPVRGKAVKVWSVSASVGDDAIVMLIEQMGDQVLNLDDQIGPSRNVLTDEQFGALGRFRYDPVTERARRRQFLPALVAGAMVGAVGATLAFVAGKRQLSFSGKSSDAVHDGANSTDVGLDAVDQEL